MIQELHSTVFSFFNLEHLQLFFFFSFSDTFLKNTGSLFCTTSFSVDFSDPMPHLETQV